MKTQENKINTTEQQASKNGLDHWQNKIEWEFRIPREFLTHKLWKKHPIHFEELYHRIHAFWDMTDHKIHPLQHSFENFVVMTNQKEAICEQINSELLSNTITISVLCGSGQGIRFLTEDHRSPLPMHKKQNLKAKIVKHIGDHLWLLGRIHHKDDAEKQRQGVCYLFDTIAQLSESRQEQYSFFQAYQDDIADVFELSKAVKELFFDRLVQKANVLGPLGLSLLKNALQFDESNKPKTLLTELFAHQRLVDSNSLTETAKKIEKILKLKRYQYGHLSMPETLGSNHPLTLITNNPSQFFRRCSVVQPAGYSHRDLHVMHPNDDGDPSITNRML